MIIRCNLLFKQPCYMISWYLWHINFVSCDASILNYVIMVLLKLLYIDNNLFGEHFNSCNEHASYASMSCHVLLNSKTIIVCMNNRSLRIVSIVKSWSIQCRDRNAMHYSFQILWHHTFYTCSLTGFYY